MMLFTKKPKVSTMSRGYTGFTLAEVLITLGIIGVVAEMTIPTLLNDLKDNVFRVSAKASYQMLSEATNRLSIDNSIDTTSETSVLNSFATALKTTGPPLDSDTFFNFSDGRPYTGYKNRIKTSFFSSNTPFVKLINGYYLAYMESAYTGKICTGNGPRAYTGGKYAGQICGMFYLDTNGAKGPNMGGRDFIAFSLVNYNSKYLIVPIGLSDNFTCQNPGTGDGVSDYMQNTGIGCTASYITDTDTP